MSLLPFSRFYFCYFAFLGLFNPYWPLYLERLGLSPWQLSVLVSLLGIARIVAPTFWGGFADRIGRRKPVLRATTLVAAFAFLPILWIDSFWPMFAVLAASHLFWAASLPLVEAGAAQATRGAPGRYGRTRVWGSIGFMAVALLAGYGLMKASLDLLPMLLAVGLFVIAAAAWRVPETGARPTSGTTPASLASLLARPGLPALLAACFLMAFAHGPYYTFYSIALSGMGYGQGSIGALWALGVICEIMLFWKLPSLHKRFGLGEWMCASLAAACLRFALLATALTHPAAVLFAQTLHALTFGLHHASAVALLQRAVPPEQQARGQGLYLAVSFGLGGTLGGLLAGALWPTGGAPLVYGVSTLAALIGFAVSLSVRKTLAV
ncbi:MFS transporter [Crenobacter cavernae]|uniref:MFS transporter n=1 Tax=Crenobacter cavernae TaxID=2290923 RepID=A0A345Y7E0_9NEIS|nr:MFS transporter [Crenobacter cavernae]AXK39842.1 MFS transporter [Crenobacter cavernae]